MRHFWDTQRIVGALRDKRRVWDEFTVMHIYSINLKYMIIAVPPLSDQVAIAGFLGRVVKDMDGARYRAWSQIELVREYGARLIADVVTGKLDVRGAAAALPDLEALARERGVHADGTQLNSYDTERGTEEVNP